MSQQLATARDVRVRPEVDYRDSLSKELKEVLSLPISVIFQTSYANGIVPEDWKNANVTAIHKKSDKHIADNYRPISLISVICKLLHGKYNQ